MTREKEAPILQMQKEYEAMTGMDNGQKKGDNFNVSGWFAAQARRIWNGTMDEEGLKQRAQAMVDARADYKKFDMAVSAAILDPETVKRSAQKQLRNDPEYKKLDSDAVMEGSGLLLSLQNRVQPQYYGIEDMAKKIQLEALGENPLQERIRQIQLDQLDQLIKMSSTLQEILGKDYTSRLR